MTLADLKLDSNFSIHLDDTNDIAIVEGVEAFEQMVAVRLTELMRSVLADTDSRDTVKSKIRLEVSRVARENDYISGIRTVDIRDDPDNADAILVTIHYVGTERVFERSF